MHITIDASNLRKGGGVTHLQEVLNVVDLQEHGVDKITVWAPKTTLDRIGDLPNVVMKSHPWIDRGRWHGVWFRKRYLDNVIDPDTDLLWAPGGTYLGKFRPYVTMVRNFLPFDKPSRDRYKHSREWYRLKYLCHVQTKSFENASGLIHISEKTNEVINSITRLDNVRQTTVHHGLNQRFLLKPRAQRSFDSFTEDEPVKLLYISHINHYKHQDKLVEAVARVRAKGIPVQVDLVGPAYPPAKRKFDAVADRLDPTRSWINWHNEVPYAQVQQYYAKADLYAFMSSCETFGIILLEAMASGLPILASDRSAIPEINGGTCPEVDPEDVDAVAAGLERLIRDKHLRETCAQAAYERAQSFTWKKCADETFAFLSKVAEEEIKRQGK